MRSLPGFPSENIPDLGSVCPRTDGKPNRHDSLSSGFVVNSMENQTQSHPPTHQVSIPSHGASVAPRADADALRKCLERKKIDLEKLTQKNAASNEYVTRAEKTERDVAKAGDDYKSASAKLQAAKRDAEDANKSQSKEATAEIGHNQGAVETATSEVDQPIRDYQKEIDKLAQRKAASEAKFGEAQNSLAAAQAALQESLAYQAELTAGLKAVADLHAKLQKVNDHAHAAEFYFYTTEARKKLDQINVKTPDELNAELSEKLAAVEGAIGYVVDAKEELIDVSVDLDVKQKYLADLDKNREAQILAKIKPYNQPAAKPSKAPAGDSAKQNPSAK